MEFVKWKRCLNNRSFSSNPWCSLVKKPRVSLDAAICRGFTWQNHTSPVCVIGVNILWVVGSLFNCFNSCQSSWLVYRWHLYVLYSRLVDRPPPWRRHRRVVTLLSVSLQLGPTLRVEFVTVVIDLSSHSRVPTGRFTNFLYSKYSWSFWGPVSETCNCLFVLYKVVL